MKKYLVLTSVLIIVLVFSNNQTFAQQKIGCINSNDLISAMPENDSASAVIEARTQEFVKQIEEIQVELNNKLDKYQKERETLNNLIRKTREDELNSMNANLENFRSAADQELQKLREELYRPIIEKAKKAIQEVADEGGFTYIIDSAVNTLLVFPDKAPLNILEPVKAKLKID